MPAAYERLPERDAAFLLFETPDTHMHLGGVAVFDAGPLARAGGGIDAARIRAQIAARLHQIPRYRQRLAWIPVLNHPVWVDDAHFLSYRERLFLGFNADFDLLPDLGDLVRDVAAAFGELAAAASQPTAKRAAP